MLMPNTTRSWTDKAARIIRTLVWVVLAIVVLQQLFSSGRVSGQRAALLDQFQRSATRASSR